jgi:CRISPR type III-B/RAMP module RAMP protein Cmr1
LLYLGTELLPTAKELNEFVENKIESQVIATFDLENITHARLGGYNANVSSHDIGFDERIRTTAIKGIWRWWLRTVLAGAYCDAGYLVDGTQVGKYTKEVLGSTCHQSVFSLKLVEERIGSPEVFPDTYNMPSRLKLLASGIRDEKERKLRLMVYPPEALKFQVSVLKRKVPKNSLLEEKTQRQDAINTVAIGSLGLALLLGGLGSITRRGFGHFHLNLRDVSGNLKELSDKFEMLYRNPTCENFESLRSYVVEGAVQLLGLERKETMPDRETMPDFPCLCKKHFRIELHSVNLKRNDRGARTSSEEALLAKFGKSVLKDTWKRMNQPKLRGKAPGARQTAKGDQYQTWILGLPRHSYIKGRNRGSSKELTGYAGPNKEELRRSSAIYFAPLKKETQGNYLTLVFGFKSKDWRDINHYSYRNVSHSILQQGHEKECQISNAFDLAFRTVCSYLDGDEI